MDAASLSKKLKNACYYIKGLVT